MKFLTYVMKNSGISTAYGIAKSLGCTPSLVDTWLGKNKKKAEPTGIKLRYLCKLFKLSSLSGNEFMIMLCGEYLEKKDEVNYKPSGRINISRK